MKIHNIHFKNINSLEGVNRINFEGAPFSNTGVFAITGPNGSGKSSILDAITLGLYGETFRFDRPAAHVMTKNTADCFSEIEFSLGEERYRSSWSVQKEGANPSGEVLPAEMKLIRINGAEEVVAESPQRVCSRITEITGMNFRNFTRSILLAQGDFAAFLTALDSERMAILETIISSDIYADYKKEIIEKANTAENRLQQLQSEISLIPVMEPEKLEAAEQDLADFNDQYVSFQSEINELQQLELTLQKIESLENMANEQDGEIQELKQQELELARKLDKIAENPEAIQFKDELVAIMNQNQLIQQSQSDMASTRNELKQLEQMLTESETGEIELVETSGKSLENQQQAISEVRYQIHHLDSERYAATMRLQGITAQVNEKQTELASVSEWLENHSRDKALLDNFPETAKLKSLRTEIEGLKEKKKSLEQAAKNSDAVLRNQLATADKERGKLHKMEQQLDTEISSLEILAKGRKFEAIEELRQEQQERVQSINELVGLAAAYQKLKGERSSFFGFFTRKNNNQQEANELAEELTQLWEKIKREDNIKQILDSTVTQESLMRKMIPDRHYLIDGKPCPLCGALQHPYAEKPPAVGNSQKALADQQEKLKTLHADAEKLEQQLKRAQKISDVGKANQLEAQKVSAQWISLANRLNIQTADVGINSLGVQQRLLESEEKELKEIVFLAAKYRSKQANIEKLKGSITDSKMLLERLLTDTEKLKSDRREQPDQLTPLTATLNKFVEEEKTLAVKVNEQLSALGEKMPSKGKENAFFDVMNQRRRDYQTYHMRFKSLTDELDSLSIQSRECRTEISQCQEKIAQHNLKLKSEEHVGLHLAFVETQKLIAARDQQLAEQTADLLASQQALTEKLSATEVNTMEELTELLQWFDTLPQMQQQQLQLQHEIDYRMKGLEKIRVECSAERESIGTESSLQELNEHIKNLAEKLEITDYEIQRLDSTIRDEQLNRQKYEALNSQLQEQQEINRKCQSELALLNDGSGMEFRRSVQERIAGRLLSHTNAILEKISGRYYLRQKKSNEQGLALEIEDTYQNNVRRIPKTLSGGETFIVSLALALGLSELVNNGKSVDSLFIDEGFGNLDAENLSMVITTLERLKTHGKTVGIISHVESIQKEFNKRRLRVEKKPNGMGMLKLEF